MASLCACYSLRSFVFHPSGVLPSCFMAPPRHIRTAHSTRDLWFALPQLRCAGLVTLGGEVPPATCGAAVCHSEVSRQCHQAAGEVGAARAVPREADWQLVRRELLDTLPWVLYPSGVSAAPSVQTGCGNSSGAGGLFLVPETYPQLSHGGARASHLLQTRLVSCAIPPSPWADPHTFPPEKLCSPFHSVAGGRAPLTPHLGRSRALSSQEQLPAGLGCVARGHNQHSVPCKQWH